MKLLKNYKLVILTILVVLVFLDSIKYVAVVCTLFGRFLPILKYLFSTIYDIQIALF